MDNPAVPEGIRSRSLYLEYPRVFQRIKIYRYFNKNSSILPLFTGNKFDLKSDDLYTRERFRIKYL